MTVTTLPVDLAPTLRAAAEQLIAECGEAGPRRPQNAATNGVRRCVFCKRRGGKLGGHHLDDGTVVDCHPKCHRRHHTAENAKAAAHG